MPRAWAAATDAGVTSGMPWYCRGIWSARPGKSLGGDWPVHSAVTRARISPVEKPVTTGKPRAWITVRAAAIMASSSAATSTCRALSYSSMTSNSVSVAGADNCLISTVALASGKSEKNSRRVGIRTPWPRNG